jgi:hypothetical protein
MAHKFTIKTSINLTKYRLVGLLEVKATSKYWVSPRASMF